MGKSAVLIHVRPQVISSNTYWTLEPLQGTPTLVHLLKRLHKGLPAGDFEFHVVCHEGIMSEKLPEVLKGTQTALFISKASGRLETFAQFAETNAHLRTLMIFDERAIFPDCMLTIRALQLHRQQHAEGTVAPEFPSGLLPQIYQAEALHRLQKLELPDDISTDFASVMLNANQLFEGDEEARDLQFKLLEVGRDDLSDAPVAEKLPARLLIEGSNEKAAAEAVLQKRTTPRYDSTEAYLYKEEVLRAEMSENFPFQTNLPAREPGTVPILYVSMYGTFSGAEQSFANLIIHLDRTRFHPIVVLGQKNFLSEKLIAAGIHVEIAGFNFMTLKPQSTRYFDALLKNFGIRLVHCNGLTGEALPLAAHYAGIPMVFHQRNFQGNIVPSIMKYAAKIITVSEAVARDLRRSELAPEKIQCIYNGQDLNAFRADQYDRHLLRQIAHIDQNTRVISLIARIAAQKRLEFLLEALPNVIRKFPNTLALFVGEFFPSEAPYYERIQKLVDNLGLRDHVRFWGFEKDIVKIHSMSDVLVNCTLNEPFGRSILEALSMRVPVVAPNRGGHLEMLRHNENALLFDARSPQSLSLELIRLFSMPELADRLKQNGLKTVLNFDIATHVRQVSALYDGLLNDKK